MQSEKEQHTLYALIAVFFAGLGGFLYGYLTSIISGALIFLKEEFSLSLFQEGLAVSIILIGALLGAFFAGSLADYFGRRLTIMITAVLFIIGTWEVAAAGSFSIFLMGRFITGVAVGIISLTTPLYLSELAPSQSRGAFVAVNQLAITIGVLGAYIVNYMFSSSGDWRWMMAIGIIPAAIKLIGMAFLPESPAWLIAKGKPDRALYVMGKIRKGESWKNAFSEFIGSFTSEKSKGWKELLKPSLRMALIVGVGVCILQQIAGINAVTYYCAKIFQMAGYSSPSQAIRMSIIIGVVNVLATFLSLWILDRVGRRPLLLIGMLGMALSLVLLSLAFYTSTPYIGPVAIGCLIGYIAFFAIGIGPITWVIICELFSVQIRGKAMTVGIFANWASNYVVSLTFLNLNDSLGTAGTFLLYALISLFAFWFIYRFLPETKGKSPKEIEKAFQKR